jgi:hypothetical protein
MNNRKIPERTKKLPLKAFLDLSFTISINAMQSRIDKITKVKYHKEVSMKFNIINSLVLES